MGGVAVGTMAGGRVPVDVMTRESPHRQTTDRPQTSTLSLLPFSPALITTHPPRCMQTAPHTPGQPLVVDSLRYTMVVPSADYAGAVLESRRQLASLGCTLFDAKNFCEPVGSEPVGFEHVGSEHVGSEPVGIRAVGFETLGSESMGLRLWDLSTSDQPCVCTASISRPDRRTPRPTH